LHLQVFHTWHHFLVDDHRVAGTTRQGFSSQGRDIRDQRGVRRDIV
jgi:hypothetical protein